MMICVTFDFVFFVASGCNTKVCGIRDKLSSINVRGTTTAWGEKVRHMKHVSPHPINRSKMGIQVFCDVTKCFELSDSDVIGKKQNTQILVYLPVTNVPRGTSSKAKYMLAVAKPKC